MNVRRKTAAMACAMVSFAALGLPETGNAAGWLYVGATGAVRWGQLAPEFEACAAGAEPLPIDLTVLGDMMASGETNALFHDILEKSPLSTGEVDFGVSDVSPLMQVDDGFFRDQGSLTTPPCSEIVVWTVFRSPIAVSADDIAASRAIFQDNLRPLQPTGWRFVLSE